MKNSIRMTQRKTEEAAYPPKQRMGLKRVKDSKVDIMYIEETMLKEVDAHSTT